MKDDVVVYKHKEPCNHKGCLQHINKPCDGCGRFKGEGEVKLPKQLLDIWKQTQ